MCRRACSQAWCVDGNHFFGDVSVQVVYTCAKARANAEGGRTARCSALEDMFHNKNPVVDMCDDCLAKQMQEMGIERSGKELVLWKGGKGEKGDRRSSFP